MIQEKTVGFPDLENCSLSRFYNRPSEGLEAKVCVCLRFMGNSRENWFILEPERGSYVHLGSASVLLNLYTCFFRSNLNINWANGCTLAASLRGKDSAGREG